MKIDKLVVGNLRENCYVLFNENNCLLVDPGDDIDKIKKSLVVSFFIPTFAK